MAIRDIDLWSERNVARMGDAVERSLLQHRRSDLTLDPLIGFGLWVDDPAGEPRGAPLAPKAKYVTLAGNRVVIDGEDSGGDGVSPTIATVQSTDPVQAIRDSCRAEFVAYGMSLPSSDRIYASAADLDAELQAVTSRRHLVALANGDSFQREWSGDRPSEREPLATTQYSDALRRALRLPTPPPDAPLATGLVLLWMVRIRRTLKSRAISPSDVVALLPASLPTGEVQASDVIGALREASLDRTWPDLLRQLKAEAPDLGEWFDIGSFSRCRSGELSLQLLCAEYRSRATALLRLVHQELVPVARTGSSSEGLPDR